LDIRQREARQFVLRDFAETRGGIFVFQNRTELRDAGGRKVDYGGSIGDSDANGALFIFESAEVHKD
jgi:hypothetical protein